MKYLGIDYGKKNIGIALSDEEGRIAFPRAVLAGADEEAAIEKILEICEKEKVGKIIIGFPLSLERKITEQTRLTENFANHLQKDADLPIDFENEIFTSKVIEREIKAGRLPKEKIDAASAAVILQSYLDKHKE